MQTINMEMAAEKLVMRIRLQAFHNVLSQPMAWYDFNKNTVGSLLTRMDRDAPLIKGVRLLRGALQFVLVPQLISLWPECRTTVTKYRR